MKLINYGSNWRNKWVEQTWIKIQDVVVYAKCPNQGKRVAVLEVMINEHS
jgi:hypothetical protein